MEFNGRWPAARSLAPGFRRTRVEDPRPAGRPRPERTTTDQRRELQTKALAARVGLARSWAAETHVEAHAAETMDRFGLREAVLAVNKRPCPGMQGCDRLLPRLLPAGAQLTVYGPDGFRKTYNGPEENHGGRPDRRGHLH
ncbi:DddA-like double-stranded DNA deaminase toxin [Polymorphospora sp. NPDC051019]|uniref:DddA-like double-stranded DNA deaminase toxin n=1 Tax=Polymorphospora sp. NPDC051019 TaxID=3155725 RepID=UPI003436F307